MFSLFSLCIYAFAAVFFCVLPFSSANKDLYNYYVALRRNVDEFC